MADVAEVYFKTHSIANDAADVLRSSFIVSAPHQVEPYEGRPWMVQVQMPKRRLAQGIDQRDFGIVLRVANTYDGIVHDDDPDWSQS